MGTRERRVILAHDSLTQLGGAEKVVDVLHEMFPQSPLYVLVLAKALQEKYKSWDIRTSLLQIFYNVYAHFQHLLPFIPFAVWSLKLPEDSVIVSSSSGFIKGIRKPKNSVHINYCHAPTRFLWTDSEYISQEVPALLRPLANIFLSWLKHWDKKAAGRVDYFIANSKEVQKRIQDFYGRESVVIYPPIDTEFWSAPVSSRLSPNASEDEQRDPSAATPFLPSRRMGNPHIPRLHSSVGMTQDYFLLAGRLQAHKKNDLIVEMFNELGLPLHVVGTGRQEKYLKSLAKPNITFYGRISDEELRQQYKGALGFIYPQIEDAGLMPLEAAASGTASIGISKAGSLETIIPGVTGELFSEYDKEEIKEIIRNWDAQKYNKDAMKNHAEKFSKQVFKEKVEEYINTCSK